MMEKTTWSNLKEILDAYGKTFTDEGRPAPIGLPVRLLAPDVAEAIQAWAGDDFTMWDEYLWMLYSGTDTTRDEAEVKEREYLRNNPGTLFL